VENKAINIDHGDDTFGLNNKPTDIKITTYGDFISHFPTKTTYFQPIWEKLLYQNPPIINEGPFLCLEGISDFHLLSYVARKSKIKTKFSIIPGVGAGGFEKVLPSIYGSGANFFLLLDGDKKGSEEKQRYVNQGILASNKVFCLSDIEEQFKNQKLEDLLSKDTREKVRERFNNKNGKKQIGMYLAEISASEVDDALSDDTFEKCERILIWAQSLFQNK